MKILGFVDKIKYRFLDKAGQRINKEMRFYLALSDTRLVKLSSEHINFKWAGYEEAIEILSFHQSIPIPNKAVKMKKALMATTTN